MISENIKEDINKALKQKDETRVRTLRMLSSELHNLKIDKKELSEEDELSIVKKEVKKRKDAIEAYKKAGASDKADAEEAEMQILQEYLPEQMSEQELEEIVKDAIDKTGASEMKDMGKVIGIVMGKVGAAADGAKVAEIAKQNLQK